jgi:hypothetical protein
MRENWRHECKDRGERDCTRSNENRCQTLATSRQVHQGRRSTVPSHARKP